MSTLQETHWRGLVFFSTAEEERASAPPELALRRRLGRGSERGVRAVRAVRPVRWLRRVRPEERKHVRLRAARLPVRALGRLVRPAVLPAGVARGRHLALQATRR